MNSLERSRIEKAGYDNGWENVLVSGADRVELGSALHRLEAEVRPVAGGDGWVLRFPEELLAAELANVAGVEQGEEGFPVSGEEELGRLLKEAAKLAKALPDAPEVRFREAVRRELEHATLATEVERLVRQRVGQDIYRESLMGYWGGACAVTGLAVPELLRASHARPWAECTSDAERLNVFNGFLLGVHIDALFDRHLMTFDDSGAALFAPAVTAEVRRTLGIAGPLALRRLSPDHLPFLRHHRDTFLRKHGGQFSR